MWGEKPSSAPRWLEKVNWESLAVHLPTFKAKVGRDQGKKIPHQGWKRRAETFGWQSSTLLHLFHWSFFVLCPIIWNERLNFTASFPFPFRYGELIQAQSSAAILLGKHLFIQASPLERKKPQGAMHSQQGTRLLNLLELDDAWEFKPLPLLCERLENSGGGIWLWSLSLRKWAHSTEPRGNVLTFEHLTKSCPLT